MNCDSLQSLMDETPLARWSDEQKLDAAAHCSDCDSCGALLRQEQSLFGEFRELVLPTPETGFDVRQVVGSRTDPVAAVGLWRIATILSVLFLSIGSVYQSFRENGFSWIPDGSRLESVISVVTGSPGLSVALILIGLVYCLALPEEIEYAT